MHAMEEIMQGTSIVQHIFNTYCNRTMKPVKKQLMLLVFYNLILNTCKTSNTLQRNKIIVFSLVDYNVTIHMFMFE